MSDIKTDGLSEKDAKATKLTENFTDKENMGEDKSADASEDISRGMPHKDQENLEKVTRT